MKIDQYVRKATVNRVVDGDTIDLNIDLGWDISMLERVRLVGVDTPEVRGPERERGLEFSAFVKDWLKEFEFVWLRSERYDSGKYGRTLGSIYSPGGECLNDVLAERIRDDTQ